MLLWYWYLLSVYQRHFFPYGFFPFGHQGQRPQLRINKHFAICIYFLLFYQRSRSTQKLQPISSSSAATQHTIMLTKSPKNQASTDNNTFSQFPPWTRATQFADVQGRTSIRKGGVFQEAWHTAKRVDTKWIRHIPVRTECTSNATRMPWSYGVAVAARPSKRYIIF